MTGHHPEDADRPHYDDAELDDLLANAMGGILAKLEAGFDPDAGLTDVYARSAMSDPHRSPPAPASTRREPGPSTADGRLQEVCDQIDTLDACLAAIIRSTNHAPFAGAAFLEAARPVLMQLRMGLANRMLARDDAMHLIDHVQRNLGETDRILRTQNASSLEEVTRARLGGQTQSGSGAIAEQTWVLAEMTRRLYEDADYTASLEPAR
jgi:hypothetical protein